MCHAHKKRVFSARADSPARIDFSGFGVRVWLDWPFGLRASRSHGLLIGARHSRNGAAELTLLPSGWLRTTLVLVWRLEGFGDMV